MHAQPRHFAAHGPLPGAGLPHDRMARLAARRAFVDLKQMFMAASDGIAGGDGLWLKAQIRAAEMPEDLLLLRGPLFESLRRLGEPARAQRYTLRLGLELHFPDSTSPSVFGEF